MSLKLIFRQGVVSLLSVVPLVAENAVILESFESGIASVTQGNWGGPRIPNGVSFQHYTRNGPEDMNVTDGNKSLQVDLSLAEGWVNDFLVTLSADASAKVRAATKSKDVARYILRYDYVFPGGTVWMNGQSFLGAVNDQLNSPSAGNGGKTTMSWALDLVTGLPSTGPVVLRFADAFKAVEDPFVGPLSIYLDNIRLVDTYVSGATPVTTLLQSFEDSTGDAADFTAWGGEPRTTYSQYTKSGTKDVRVTDGSKSLQVRYTGGGVWKPDFTLPFANTKLADVLKLDLPVEERPAPADLERYTLRFDVIYPDRGANNRPAWAVTGTFAYNGSPFPYYQARRDAALGQAQTVSITLDQLPDWDANVEGAPVLVFGAQGDWDDAFTLYYDNFRLIDAGNVSAQPPPTIESVVLTAGGEIIITWTGNGLLQSSPSLGKPQWTVVTGAASGVPIQPPFGPTAFYRVAAP